MSEFVFAPSYRDLSRGNTAPGRFWKNQEVQFNWKADIDTGSRSLVNVISISKVFTCVSYAEARPYPYPYIRLKYS